jgi:REP element-mobilizing transposase RayT
MARKKLITTPGIYFTTFTCFQWLPLIELTNSYDLIYKWFDKLIDKNHLVNGYVIMPNHLHMLLYKPEYYQSLNTVIGNGKRFIGYELVERLKKIENRFYLAQLKVAVEEADKLKGQIHNIWENSFEAKECRTEKFILQKLNYIHNNPCNKHWNLSKIPEEYKHSSAAFYKSEFDNDPFLSHYKRVPIC